MEMAKPENLIKIRSYKMPYGKYRGVRLIDLPESYVLWINEHQRPKGELGSLFQELYEIKVNGLESLILSLDI